MSGKYERDNFIAKGKIQDKGDFQIYYMGGSSFHMLFTDESGKPTAKPMALTRTQLDALVAAKKVRLASEARYRQIISGIQPDGSTATHKADGTPKQKTRQVMESLIKDHIIVQNEDGTVAVAVEEDNAPAAPQKRQLGPEDVYDSAEEAAADAPAPHTKEERAEEVATRQQPDREAKREARANRLEGDLNGDGVVDEFDDLVKEEQSKNVLVMIVFFAAIIVNFFLFFLFHTLSAAIFHGEEIDLIPDVITVQEQPAETEQQPDEKQQETDDEQSQEEHKDDGTYETVKRTDFDPENAVASFPFADEEREKIGTALMQAVREAAKNGSINSLAQAVQLDRIADQLAVAYAEAAQKEQNLTQVEKDEIQRAWREAFLQSEKQHIVDKDPYGSIFNGRVREVRQDPVNIHCIYIVMESISGDHQRICLAANEIESGAWEITDVMDPSGYIAMIQEGEVK